jgi:hypothetical protein
MVVLPDMCFKFSNSPNDLKTAPPLKPGSDMKVCLLSMSSSFQTIVNHLARFYRVWHVATTLFKVAITHSYDGLELLAL